jgi:hypothetical protein
MNFISKAFEAMERLNELAMEFISQVATLAVGEGDIKDYWDFLGAYIDQSAKTLAMAVCQSEKVRFVTKEVFKCDAGPATHIRCGLPANAGSHGFGLVETLYEPREEGPVQALESERVLVVDNARINSRTKYMWELAWTFNINCVVFVPIVSHNMPFLSFLIAIDLIDSDETISEEQRDFLEMARKLISRTAANSYITVKRIADRRMKGTNDILNSIVHDLGNGFVNIGGFARRIPKFTEDEKILQYAGILLAEATRAENKINELRGQFARDKQSIYADLERPSSLH